MQYKKDGHNILPIGLKNNIFHLREKEFREERLQVKSNGYIVGKFSLPLGMKTLTYSLYTSMGMRTQWGKPIATLGEFVDEETPQEVKLDGVVSSIGNIVLFFAALNFLVLT